MFIENDKIGFVFKGQLTITNTFKVVQRMYNIIMYKVEVVEAETLKARNILHVFLSLSTEGVHSTCASLVPRPI